MYLCQTEQMCTIRPMSCLNICSLIGLHILMTAQIWVMSTVIKLVQFDLTFLISWEGTTHYQSDKQVN